MMYLYIPQTQYLPSGTTSVV